MSCWWGELSWREACRGGQAVFVQACYINQHQLPNRIKLTQRGSLSVHKRSDIFAQAPGSSVWITSGCSPSDLICFIRYYFAGKKRQEGSVGFVSQCCVLSWGLAVEELPKSQKATCWQKRWQIHSCSGIDWLQPPCSKHWVALPRCLSCCDQSSGISKQNSFSQPK